MAVLLHGLMCPIRIHRVEIMDACKTATDIGGETRMICSEDDGGGE